MFLTLALLCLQQVIGENAIEKVLNTPVQFNFDDPISDFITSRNSSDEFSTHNCLIVPCTVVSRQQNCMVITKLTYGGDCYTWRIKSSLNFSDPDPENVATLEFSYLAVHHPQALKQFTGITVGWTQDDGNYVWIAAEDISLIKTGAVNSTNSTAQFVTINSLAENTWTKVRVHIRPPNNDPFRIIFEDFIDAADFAGQFLITNITIFDRGVCSANCGSCLSYYECTSCDTDRLYRGACVSDLCYFDATSITANQISIGWIYEANQIYGIALKNIKITDCYNVTFIMNKVNSNPINSSNPSLQIYQYGFKINNETLKTVGCGYYSKLPKSNLPGYECYFEFYLTLIKTAVDVVNLTWTQEFYYNESNLVMSEIAADKINMVGLTQSLDLGTASTSVNGKILLCESSSCRSFYQSDQEKILYLNEPFYILVMLDNEYQDFGADFKFQLVSAIAVGNGTSITLKALNEAEKNMTATIYTFKVPYAVNNCTIQITAQLTERIDDGTTTTGSGRRLLQNLRMLQTATTDTQTSTNSAYTVSGSIKIEGFEILPGWKIYEARDVPYIIIGVSGGFIVLLIVLYCMYLQFCMNTGMGGSNPEQAIKLNELEQVTDQGEIDRIRRLFGDQS